ncbi:MAG: UbiA family prenyltransferase [Nocardioidaceae bacterium]
MEQRSTAEGRTSTMEHPRTTGRAIALARTAHGGPALAVTAVAALLAVTADVPAGRTVLVVAAVLTGQLSIGWSNDLIDVRRDRAVHRIDKPLVTGELPESLVRLSCALALGATVVLSLACGPTAGLVQLLCVAGGWAYNLGLKSTVWSWLPYAVAFGALPVFVALAGDGGFPALWVPVAGALLGVGAHLVNALPDLDDDLATGVRGLPHRIGARWTGPLATAVLVAASVLICVAAPLTGHAATWAGLLVVVALAVVAVTGRGRTPFRAAMGIALVDVALLAGSR